MKKLNIKDLSKIENEITGVRIQRSLEHENAVKKEIEELKV